MPREAPEIRLIRETLEGVVHPSTASTLFFEALQTRGGVLPSDTAEALELADGPIRTGLVQRIGDHGAVVADEIVTILRSIGGGAPAPTRNEVVTRAIAISEQSLIVFVLTAAEQLVGQLRAALGPQVMSSVQIADTETLHMRLEQIAPGFVLIDASQFAPIEPSALVQALAQINVDVVKAIWGSDLPYGQAVIDAAQRVDLDVTPFDRREGIEPLMDVIRSRQS